MNILIIGKPLKNLYNAFCNSKRPHKLYTATTEPLDDIPNIEFDSFESLAYKAKALKIDIAVTTDKDLIEAGITDALRKSYINIFAANKKWFNLESSNLIAKQLVTHYSINTPEVLKAPLSFPVVFKTDKPELTYIAGTMADLVEKMNLYDGKKTFLEEYLQGETYNMTLLWDGKNIFSETFDGLTEVQEERLELFKTKLHFLLSDENADFIGFFSTKLLWAKNDWYLLNFKMRPDENTVFKHDLIQLLNSALYQKLNEIQV